MLFGALEAGGTKMVCAVVTENGELIDKISMPTTTPEENIPAMVQYFKKYNLAGLGVGSFGPLNLRPGTPNYGAITRTPKYGWDYVNFRTAFEAALGIPVGIDTDVNAAILGEVCFGAAQGLESAIYITVGTGIGVGVYVNGGLLHGLSHAEAGHIMLLRHPKDSFAGCCRFHGACFEGLASGPSIGQRWGKPAYELYNQQEVWDIEAYYIAQAITNYILCYAPQKIILWGGVMHNEALLPKVRELVYKNINGYLELEDEYIVAPGLGDNPGIIGASQLGYRAYLECRKE